MELAVGSTERALSKQLWSSWGGGQHASKAASVQLQILERTRKERNEQGAVVRMKALAGVSKGAQLLETAHESPLRS